MRGIVCDVKGGRVSLEEAPAPRCGDDEVLVRTSRSLISTGTERSLVEFGRAGYLSKAKQQPERVKMVLEKIRTDGLLSTIDAVRSKLGEPLPMGYSNVGVVEEVGAGVTGIARGDRVLSNGPHAELVSVPQNLCARVPESVTDEEATFGVVGAVALQGVRLAQPTLGETFLVMGLGLIGLLTVQILRANGCVVIGIDPDEGKANLARGFGADVVPAGVDASVHVDKITKGRGADGVIIAASTESDDVVHEAAQMSRKRGRIVLVGVVGLNLRRSDFYEKELSFQVSCSYGPGRYDPSYEKQGRDYPLAYVRWTEQRNFEAVLGLMASGQLDVGPLVSSRYPLEAAPDAYDQLLSDRGVLGIVLEYPVGLTEDRDRAVMLGPTTAVPGTGDGVVGAIGAGNYAGRILLPAFKDAGADLRVISSSGGRSAANVGKRLGFQKASTDLRDVFDDEDVDVVVVATRHDSHASLVVRALEAGKHVFVEKPLALSLEDVTRITTARQNALARGEGGRVMVGFNRRFAPLAKALKKAVDRAGAPFSLVYTCNAGQIPPDSWVHDPVSGGGRIVGEACHFIDLARFLAGSPIKKASLLAMDDLRGLGDSATMSLKFESGSIAVVHYFANGHRSFPKERIEVFQAGRVLTLDNFRKLSVRGDGLKVPRRRLRQDKGQAACVAAFIDAVRNGGEDPIPFEEILEVSRVTLELAQAARA